MIANLNIMRISNIDKYYSYYDNNSKGNYILLEYVIIYLSVFITKLTPENLYLEIQGIIPF